MPDVLADSQDHTAVHAEAPALPPVVSSEPAVVRRRTVVVGVAVTMVVAVLAGGGVWWNRAVTADPGLEFHGGPNVFRDVASTDMGGIVHKDNKMGSEVDVAFVPGGRVYASFGLYNGGARDVRIEAPPAGRFYYWALERMSLSTEPDDGWVGTARNFAPFKPFTLRRGETREVRLEFRLADCDPAALQPGGWSTLRGLSLRYRTLGVTRSRLVRFRHAVLALRAMGICRHPLTDREP